MKTNFFFFAFSNKFTSIEMNKVVCVMEIHNASLWHKVQQGDDKQ